MLVISGYFWRHMRRKSGSIDSSFSFFLKIQYSKIQMISLWGSEFLPCPFHSVVEFFANCLTWFSHVQYTSFQTSMSKFVDCPSPRFLGVSYPCWRVGLLPACVLFGVFFFLFPKDCPLRRFLLWRKKEKKRKGYLQYNLVDLNLFKTQQSIEKWTDVFDEMSKLKCTRGYHTNN